RPSVLIIRRLAAFNGARFSVAVPAHARQRLEYLSIDGSRSAAGTSCPNRPAHGRTKGAHRWPAVNSSTQVSRVPSLAGGEVNAPSTRRKSPQIRGAPHPQLVYPARLGLDPEGTNPSARNWFGAEDGNPSASDLE